MSENTASSFYETRILRNVTGDTIRPGGLDITSRALEFCDFAPGCTILDIGCGCGATQKLLSGCGYQSFGIDPSLIQMQQNISESRFNIQAYGEAVPLKDNSFDGVFLECTLSVVNQPDKVISEIYRLIKPGGLLVLSDLYARNAYGIPPLRSALMHGCFNSIWSEADVSTMIRTKGLDTVLWEDHCDAIRNMAGRIIFDQGSMNAFWQNHISFSNTPSFDALSFQLLLTRAKISYFLLIAQKRINDH